MEHRKSPFIIPLIISHQGCPHQCVFCNQRSITGMSGVSLPSPEEIQQEIKSWLKRPRDLGRPVQVAFYGGSFTALPRTEQEKLLGAVTPFFEDRQVDAIRLSTRPDSISVEICDLLRHHGVTEVELGVQSLDDAVLAASGRGHSVGQIEAAFAMLRQAGLKIGGQLMLGLPGDSTRTLMRSVRRLIALRPDFVRLYPTVVVADSPLAGLYATGRYQPLSLNRAIGLAAMAKRSFDDHAIPVIRVGLQPTESLSRSVIAGPYHPSFGELVQARIFFRRARALLRSVAQEGKANILSISAKDQSIFRGPGNVSLRRLKSLGLLDGVTISYRAELPRNHILLAPEDDSFSGDQGFLADRNVRSGAG